MGLSPTSNFNSAINLQFLKYISLRHVVIVKVRGNVLVGFFLCVLFVHFLFFFVIVVGVIFFFRREGVFWVGLFAFDSSLIV